MAIPSTGYDTATITNPSSALTDFTLIVDLSRMSTSWWADVNTSDGTRGRASKNDGTTELACDWIDFNDTAETGLLRVKWSGTLASSGTQVIRIYPPNTANTAYAASDTYGQYNAYDSSWLYYFPYDGSADRTTNQLNGTFSGGTPSIVSGKIGNGLNFTSSIFMNLGTQSPSIANSYQAEQWIQIDLSETGNHYMQYVSSGFGSGFYMYVDDGIIRVRRFDSALKQIIGTTEVRGLSFVNITTSFDTTNGMELFINNVSEGIESGTTPTSNITNIPITISGTTTGVNGFSGVLNQTVLHSLNRGSVWRTQEYTQTNDNATFWGTWTWNAAGGAFTLDADSGSFSISGSDVGLLADREIAAESGSYNITGSAVDLLATKLLGADSGTYNLTGSDVSLDLTVGFTLDADSGSFTINGSDVELERTYVLNADSGDYDLNGSDVQLIWSGQPLANGYVCMTLSGKTPQIIYTARKPEIGIDGKSPGTVIGGKGCR